MRTQIVDRSHELVRKRARDDQTDPAHCAVDPESEAGRVRLQPENDGMEAMYPEQVRILGTVKAVLRRL